MTRQIACSLDLSRIQPRISVKANAREARVKGAEAAGRNQNRRLLRGFTV
jgi:hypothetical protein